MQFNISNKGHLSFVGDMHFNLHGLIIMYNTYIKHRTNIRIYRFAMLLA